MVLPSRRGGVQQKSVKSKSGAFWCVLSKVATRGIKESMILGNGLLHSYLFVVLFQLMDIHWKNAGKYALGCGFKDFLF